MKKILYAVFVAIITLGFVSCATTGQRPPAYSPQGVCAPILRQDIVHVVAPGETFWRISKMYDVPMKDIMRANNLSLNEILEKGQRLRVPQAAPPVPVIPLYPSRKWKYIVIHHSATDEGSSLSFDRYHLEKGWEGVGYHFVINNGSKEKPEGQIEVSPRWLKQKNGAHCNVSHMNEQGIGICLVGNFNKEAPSQKQLNALLYLTDKLRKYYQIPQEHILGHGQVNGASTQCPGEYFPWNDFKQKLNTCK